MKHWTRWRILLQLGLVTLLVLMGCNLTESSDELALIQKRECEIDLTAMGCSGISSTCEFIGSMANCNCHAANCTKTMTITTDLDDYRGEHLENSPNSKLDRVEIFSLKKSFENFLAVLRRQFRLRYGLEGIGTRTGFLRLGFCRLPLEERRNDVCFFMHWFFPTGFKQLNVRFGHRVTNSSSASV